MYNNIMRNITQSKKLIRARIHCCLKMPNAQLEEETPVCSLLQSDFMGRQFNTMPIVIPIVILGNVTCNRLVIKAFAFNDAF